MIKILIDSRFVVASAAASLILLMAGQGIVSPASAQGLPDDALEVVNSENTVLMTVQEGGNVGIGTTSPRAILDVNGSALIDATGATSPSAGLELRGDAGTYGPSVGLNNGGQQWNLVSWEDNSLRFVKITGTTFTPMTIHNNSFADAIVIGENGVGIGTSSPTVMLDVAGDIGVTGTVDGVDVAALRADVDELRSAFVQFGNLNHGSVDVTQTPTELNTGDLDHTFTKVHEETRIEVIVNSRLSVADFQEGTIGVLFQVRLDGEQVAQFENRGSIIPSSAEDFQSIYAVFEDVAAGPHSVSIWAWAAPAPGGGAASASDVLVDSGGWGGKMIVKETW